MGARRGGALRRRRARRTPAGSFCRALSLSDSHHAAIERMRCCGRGQLTRSCSSRRAAVHTRQRQGTRSARWRGFCKHCLALQLSHKYQLYGRAGTYVTAAGPGQALSQEETSALGQVVCDRLRACLAVATAALERTRAATCVAWVHLPCYMPMHTLRCRQATPRMRPRAPCG